MSQGFLDELRWRGQLHQTTAAEPLDKHLATPGRVAYVGFDPTLDSLTIGNLIAATLLRRWQRAGPRMSCITLTRARSMPPSPSASVAVRPG